MNKKKKKRTKLTNHAKIRLRQRCELIISYEKIVNVLKNGGFIPVKKPTNTRRLMYGIVDNKPIKLIYSKKTKKIVTVLTMYWEYSIPGQEIELNENRYYIQLFPDCFLETNDPRKLTIFKKYENNNLIEYDKNNIEFEEVFYIVWKKYWESLMKNQKGPDNEENCFDETKIEISNKR